MQLPRFPTHRRSALIALAALALPALPALATAQTGAWPAKPITFVVPQAAGGANDVIARAVAQALGESLGQGVVVENRPGANGNLGSSQVARSAGDGYTWLVTAQSAYTINPALYSKTGFDLLTDFKPVMQLGVAPYLLVVHPDLPAKNLAELVAYARSHPGQINYASAGNGTLNHLLGEMLKKQENIEMTHVPYRGASAAAAEVAGGQVPVTFGSFPGVMPFVRSGKLRVLGVASAKPTPLAPEVPPPGRETGRHLLVRPLCPRRHARRHHQPHASGRQKSPGHPRNAQAPGNPGRRTRRIRPRQLQGPTARRAGPLEKSRAGIGRTNRLND